jgi:elongator complex protein 1
MIAKHTQKDPKEYLPYLKKLQELDPYLMKYNINYDLKSYDDALIELSKAGDKYFDKCLELINQFELYDLAFELFQNQDDLFIILNEEYGKYLTGKKKYLEAGYAFLRNGSKDQEALKSFTVK